MHNYFGKHCPQCADTQSSISFSFMIDASGGYPASWIGVMHIGTIMGMFASSSFVTDMIMMYYHLKKEDSPMKVYKLLQVSDEGGNQKNGCKVVEEQRLSDIGSH